VNPELVEGVIEGLLSLVSASQENEMNISLEVIVGTDSVRVIGAPKCEAVRALVDELRLAAVKPTLFPGFRQRWGQFAAQAMALENAIVFAQTDGQKVKVDEYVVSGLSGNEVEFCVSCRIELPLHIQAAS